MKRFTIRKQRYPAYDGSRPVSFAIYYGREFIAYSWSFSRAWVAVQYLKKCLQVDGER